MSSRVGPALNGLSAESPSRRAVAAIIQRGDRFLFGLRSAKKKIGASMWSPISGSIEPGETEERAIERECLEEIGVRARASRFVVAIPVVGAPEISLRFWFVEILEGEPVLTNDEHVELRWFTCSEMRATPNFYKEDIDVYERLASTLR